MYNKAIEIGRMTTDPELRQTPNGVPVTTFRIAVPRKYQKDKTDFLTVVAWRKQAEFVCGYFSKGKWIGVDGRLETRPYTDKEGHERTAYEIIADDCFFVGDRPKDEGAAHSDAPPPPPGVDPFGIAAPPPASASGYEDFAPSEDDGDLPF